jgi:hypothetical protein
MVAVGLAGLVGVKTRETAAHAETKNESSSGPNSREMWYLLAVLHGLAARDLRSAVPRPRTDA